MNLNERISKVISYSELSSSEFADEIDVQRSNISHITSGRNKPSLDFLIKIKEKLIVRFMNRIYDNMTWTVYQAIFALEEDKFVEDKMDTYWTTKQGCVKWEVFRISLGPT